MDKILGEWQKFRYNKKNEILTVYPGISISISPISEISYEINILGDKEIISVNSVDEAKSVAQDKLKEKLQKAIKNIPR